MPFKTETLAPGESTSKNIGQAMRKVGELEKGESILATIGDASTPIVVVQPALSEDEQKEKTALVNLLLTCVDPPLLSRRHPNPLADKISFTEKVKGMTLPELRRFVPDNLDPLTIDPAKVGVDFKDELYRKYKDLSP